jgi:hypothetical protein
MLLIVGRQQYYKRADADSFKAAGVMRPKTRRRFTQAQSKCLAGGYKRAIMTVIITIDKGFDVKQKKNILVSIFLTKILIFSKTEVKYVR